jgi:hypothetical protein
VGKAGQAKRLTQPPFSTKEGELARDRASYDAFLVYCDQAKNVDGHRLLCVPLVACTNNIRPNKTLFGRRSNNTTICSGGDSPIPYYVRPTNTSIPLDPCDSNSGIRGSSRF